MNSFIEHIETDDFIIHTNVRYSEKLVSECRDSFNKQKEAGTAKGDFDGNYWQFYSGQYWPGMTFNLDKTKYNSHIYKRFHISYTTMVYMLKCYVMYCQGVYIYDTIYGIKLKGIIRFLQEFLDDGYLVSKGEEAAITDFLYFISTPYQEIVKIKKKLTTKEEPAPKPRRLSPVINYLAIANEIDELYSSQIDDKTFVEWFPIWFWVRITFILPLRPNEMIVTPYNCIKEKDGCYTLSVRRTVLKGNKYRIRHYDVPKDFKIFSYDIISGEVAQIITKYRMLTKNHKRKYLFDFSNCFINEMFSADGFNTLLKKFIDKYLIGNTKYNLARDLYKIKEFEYVTAGDSRHIALVNLLNSGFSEDICMELAGHSDIEASAHYYGNTSELIQNESIMQLIKETNRGQHEYFDKLKNIEISKTKTYCEFDYAIEKPSDHSICKGHREECLGCIHFHPTQEYLDAYVEEHKKRFDNSSKELIELANRILSAKSVGKTIEDYVLRYRHEAACLKIGTDYQVMGAYKEWAKNENLQTINS